MSLRRKGASLGASLAFWLGNPTLNPAVLVFLFFALSWQWTVLRLGLGLVLVFGVSWLIGKVVREPAQGSALAPEPDPSPDAPAGHLVVRWLRSLGRLTIQLIPEYLVIMLVLGAARAWLFPAVGPELGNSLLVIAGLAVAGMLFAIPTAGEIPIIQTMMAYGLGTGPAGALLMTLAPVSLPSLAMLGREYPVRVLVAVAAAVVAFGVVAGLLAVAFGF